MANPIWNKIKGQIAPPPIQSEAPINEFETLVEPDGKKSKIISFSALATGASQPIGNNKAQWRGNFSGRPELARDLMPAIRNLTRNASTRTASSLAPRLYEFFRYLDTEQTQVVSLSDITDIHGSRFWLHCENEDLDLKSSYGSVRTIINTAREIAGLSILYWVGVHISRLKTAMYSAKKKFRLCIGR